MIQNLIIEILIIWNEKKKEFENFIINLSMIFIINEFVNINIISFLFSSFIFSFIISQNILSYWHWMSKNTIKNIEFEEFDIKNLSKFHHFNEFWIHISKNLWKRFINHWMMTLWKLWSIHLNWHSHFEIL